MKNNIYARIVGLFLSVSVASSVIASDQVSVQASSDLRVTVIDESSSAAELRGLVHAALGKSLSAGMTHECKAPVQVKISVSAVSRAAKDLKKGTCDAVIVIGNSVPSALLKDGVVLKATDARSGDLNRTFYLLATTSDPAMNKLVGLAFDHAVKSTAFQDALAGKAGATSGLAATAR